MRTKKITAVVLSLMLIFSCFSVCGITAFAETNIVAGDISFNGWTYDYSFTVNEVADGTDVYLGCNSGEMQFLADYTTVGELSYGSGGFEAWATEGGGICVRLHQGGDRTIRTKAKINGSIDGANTGKFTISAGSAYGEYWANGNPPADPYTPPSTSISFSTGVPGAVVTLNGNPSEPAGEDGMVYFSGLSNYVSYTATCSAEGYSFENQSFTFYIGNALMDNAGEQVKIGEPYSQTFTGTPETVKGSATFYIEGVEWGQYSIWNGDSFIGSYNGGDTAGDLELDVEYTAKPGEEEGYDADPESITFTLTSERPDYPGEGEECTFTYTEKESEQTTGTVIITVNGIENGQYMINDVAYSSGEEYTLDADVVYEAYPVTEGYDDYTVDKSVISFSLNADNGYYYEDSFNFTAPDTPDPEPSDDPEPESSDDPVPPSTTTIGVTVLWDDNGNEHGERPESLDMNLYENGSYIDTQTVSADTSWEASWSDLSADNNYYVEPEFVPENYTLDEYYDEGANTHVFTFTYSAPDSTPEPKPTKKPTPTPEPADDPTPAPVKTKTINATISWDDNDNAAGKRPGSVTLTNYENGEYYGDLSASADNGWFVSWTDLPESNKYKVKMDNVPAGYSASSYLDKESKTYVFTLQYTASEPTATPKPQNTPTPVPQNTPTPAPQNTPTPAPQNTATPAPSQTRTVGVVITWEDNSNEKGARPQSVTAQLIGGDEVKDTAELNSGNSWSASWEKLSPYVSWKVNLASVPEGYKKTTSLNGMTFNIKLTYGASQNVTPNPNQDTDLHTPVPTPEPDNTARPTFAPAPSSKASPSPSPAGTANQNKTSPSPSATPEDNDSEGGNNLFLWICIGLIILSAVGIVVVITITVISGRRAKGGRR
ncbi:MAG: Cna B-type domain-containing protein [Clostridia bacterium]|nr:Cna B-type domain-containing protein [Clostridia bacterium]